MDVFQGCYKNRTDGTHDRRWFSAVYLMAQVAFLIVFAMTQRYIMSCFFETILLIHIAIVVGVIQPYKSHVYNVVDVILILAPALIYCSIAVNHVVGNIESSAYYNTPSWSLVFIFGLVPLFYTPTIVLYWLVLRKKLPQKLYSKVRNSLPCLHSGLISHVNSEDNTTTLLQIVMATCPVQHQAD